MNLLLIMDKSRYQAAASTSSSTWPHVYERGVPIMALVLIFGIAAYLIVSREDTTLADPMAAKMAAANPALNESAHESPTNTSGAGAIWTEDTVSEQRPAPLWRSKHLANRHYATINSQSDHSELSYLCVEGVSCGWILNLKHEKACIDDSKGKLFSVRVQSPSLVRDLESKCIAYGLVNLALDEGAKTQLTSMIKTSESLVFSSVGSTVIFRSQRYDFPDSADAINSARAAADINQDNRSL